MNTRTFSALAAWALLVMPMAAEAQQAGKTYRVGILTIGTDPRFE